MQILHSIQRAHRGLLDLRASFQSYYRGSSNRDQREFYDLESTLPYFDNVNRIICRHKRRVILSFLEKGAVAGTSATILEVGCGVGYFARILARRGHRVTGIDISPRKIEKAVHAAGREGLDELQLAHRAADIRLLDEDRELDAWLAERAGQGASGRFEVVLAADVLEHVPEEPRRTLRSLRSRLIPRSEGVGEGGRLIASVPSRLCVKDPGHVWRFLPEDWAKIFQESGFRVEGREMSRICWYGLPTPLPLAEVFDLRPE
jgi:2-polyprenyl-3-methyl-5-hydroxy-6-metoxy-1,4-benzoquinol methylase